MGQETEERTAQTAGESANPAPAAPQAAPEAAPAGKKPTRITSPEQVDDYIRVTTPGMWLLALALVVLLSAGIIWAYAARIEMKTVDQSGQETTEYVAPASFLTDGNIGN